MHAVRADDHRDTANGGPGDRGSLRVGGDWLSLPERTPKVSDRVTGAVLVLLGVRLAAEAR